MWVWFMCGLPPSRDRFVFQTQQIWKVSVSSACCLWLCLVFDRFGFVCDIYIYMYIYTYADISADTPVDISADGYLHICMDLGIYYIAAHISADMS